MREPEISIDVPVANKMMNYLCRRHLAYFRRPTETPGEGRCPTSHLEDSQLGYFSLANLSKARLRPVVSPMILPYQIWPFLLSHQVKTTSQTAFGRSAAQATTQSYIRALHRHIQNQDSLWEHISCNLETETDNMNGHISGISKRREEKVRKIKKSTVHLLYNSFLTNVSHFLVQLH